MSMMLQLAKAKRLYLSSVEGWCRWLFSRVSLGGTSFAFRGGLGEIAQLLSIEQASKSRPWSRL
jgi:hypothetical protein